MKKYPERTCLACNIKKEKKELIRIVKINNNIEFDITGKKPGRGAYVCNDLQCIEKLFSGYKLSKALKCELSEIDKVGLLNNIKGIIKSE